MQIEFIQAVSPEPAAKYLAGLIAAQLAQGRSVLWLLSGGSGVAIAGILRSWGVPLDFESFQLVRSYS